jgi:hypothetical protein
LTINRNCGIIHLYTEKGKNVNAKKLLLVAVLSLSGGAHALTLDQSTGMVYAGCAGVYMAESSIAYSTNRTDDYDRAQALLDQASGRASDLIGDGRTTDIGEATVTRLLNSYRKNPAAGLALVANERAVCREIFEKQ